MRNLFTCASVLQKKKKKNWCQNVEYVKINRRSDYVCILHGFAKVFIGCFYFFLPFFGGLEV